MSLFLTSLGFFKDIDDPLLVKLGGLCNVLLPCNIPMLLDT